MCYKLAIICNSGIVFLSQVRVGQRLAHTWFLEIAFVREVSMRVCVCPRPQGMNN